jgi:hypothetical protein
MEPMALSILALKLTLTRQSDGKVLYKNAFMLVIRSEKQHDLPPKYLLLAGFKEITLLLIEVKNEVYAHLAALSPLQQHILVLLGFPISIYTQLDGQSFTPE